MKLKISNGIEVSAGTRVKDFDVDGTIIEGVLKLYRGEEYEWCVLWADGEETVVLRPETLEAA